jgi:hypothetical protein
MTDPDTIPPVSPEISALYDAQEAILEAAEEAGRGDLRQALADLFMADDLGILHYVHGTFAEWAQGIRATVGESARDLDLPEWKEGT